ncbi:MAG TPA: transcriptional repressor [Veillonellaceae bacterium]|jgi:Fur family ferric uptake transcriptional regulator|nr:transcriptional repressor [Veillonellaceae bacterium]
MEEIDELLKSKNLKKTKARRLILDYLNHSAPRTAGEIFSDIREKDPRLSLSTIYRNCEALAEQGILVKSSLLEDGMARYEYPRNGHIHHAICLGCNRIFPIDDCPFGQFDQIMSNKYDFDVTKHRIEIYGYCHDCRKAGKDPSAPIQEK